MLLLNMFYKMLTNLHLFDILNILFCSNKGSAERDCFNVEKRIVSQGGRKDAQQQ